MRVWDNVYRTEIAKLSHSSNVVAALWLESGKSKLVVTHRALLMILKILSDCFVGHKWGREQMDDGGKF